MTVTPRPKRLLIVCPSWLGDVVMATPALRMVRAGLPGAFIGGLVRPGMDQLLAGTGFFDELHVDRAAGVMGPKIVAARIRPRRYDAALLLTNSFSTALITRLAFIPRRIGYDRDGRGLLLTDRLRPERRLPPHKGWACVPAVQYYRRAAEFLLSGSDAVGDDRAETDISLELATTPAEEAECERVLAAAGVLRENTGAANGRAYAVLNPGANDEAKRWPAERFSAVAAHLVLHHGLHVLINGSPAEAALADRVRDEARTVVGERPGICIESLPPLGTTIGSLKAIIRHAAILVTNDTGPRHIAAAFGVPCVTLFGPTDPRWTTLPEAPRGGAGTAGTPLRVDIAAEPNLPAGELADDHPERCRIDRITTEQVIAACDGLLAEPAGAAARAENGAAGHPPSPTPRG